MKEHRPISKSEFIRRIRQHTSSILKLDPGQGVLDSIKDAIDFHGHEYPLTLNEIQKIALECMKGIQDV